MSARSRLWKNKTATGGQQEAINWLERLPYNATLLQWSFSSSAVPTVNDLLTITKISSIDPVYNVTIAEVCPFTDDLDEYLCNPNTEFRKDDFIQVAFANSDDNSIGIELCFTEGE